MIKSFIIIICLSGYTFSNAGTDLILESVDNFENFTFPTEPFHQSLITINQAIPLEVPILKPVKDFSVTNNFELFNAQNTNSNMETIYILKPVTSSLPTEFQGKASIEIVSSNKVSLKSDFKENSAAENVIAENFSTSSLEGTPANTTLHQPAIVLEPKNTTTSTSIVEEKIEQSSTLPAPNENIVPESYNSDINSDIVNSDARATNLNTTALNTQFKALIEDLPCITFPTLAKFIGNNEREGESYYCGYIHVPEEHDNPESAILKLGYVVLKSYATNPDKIPLLMIQGGPGGSSIELAAAFAFWGSPPALAKVRSQRDIIAIDYRGSTYATPRLVCPRPKSLIFHRIANPNLDDVSIKKKVLKDCFNSWQGRGVKLRAFNSLEIANDYAVALPALGYPQVHVYGGSYGTIAAQYLMRDHPNVLKSVILDAPVAPYLHWPLNSPRAASNAFKNLFDNCKVNAQCRQAYPNLEKVFTDTVDKLNKQPVTINITLDGQNQAAKLNGDLWVQGLYELMYSKPKQVPAIIFATSQGKYETSSKLLADIVSYKSIFSPIEDTFVVTSGIYMSVTCADEFTFTDNDWDFTGLIPQVAKPISEYLDNDLPEMCSAWSVPLLDKRLKEPVVSDIPTLVFSAKFDPVTPPIYAEEIANSLAQSYLYISATDGHSVLNNSCAWQIINSFLVSPLNEPDGTCLDS